MTGPKLSDHRGANLVRQTYMIEADLLRRWNQAIPSGKRSQTIARLMAEEVERTKSQVVARLRRELASLETDPPKTRRLEPLGPRELQAYAPDEDRGGGIDEPDEDEDSPS